MKFDWVEFYYQAENLAQNRHLDPNIPITKSEEAALRTAISRAYYATYHRALLFMEDINDMTPPGQNGGVHERFIYRFQTHRDSTIQPIGCKLDRLKTSRHMADYEVVMPIEPQTIKGRAREALFLSKKLINTFENLKSPSMPPLIP
jgi:uncharacterized protein (UPF0332 family)